MSNFIKIIVQAILICLFAGQSFASTILLTGGALNSQALSPTAWEINVTPGQQILGSITHQVTTTGTSASVVFPLGYTWTWGNRTTDMVLLSSDAPFGTSNWNTGINLTAPTTLGTYYILFSVRGEYTLGQVFSGTNWTAGADVWNDGNDYFDMTDADLLFAHNNGYVSPWDLLLPAGYVTFTGAGFATMPVKITVAQRGGGVPEPATILLLGAGLAGLGFSRRRKRA